MAIDKRILKMGGDLSGYAPDEIQVKNISNVTSGTLSVSNGGTGITTAPTNGQLLIGSDDGTYDLATITAGSNIDVVNGPDAISVGLIPDIVLTSVTASFSGSGTNITNLNVNNVSAGTLAIARGGTGLSTTPTNGQLLIGSGSSYSLATLTAGDNITITNGSGTITISATGGGGSGSGDIEAVTAGTNLTGGGLSGSVTLNLADNINLSTVTASFSGNGVNLTSIPNSGLVNSSVTILGQTVSLGQTATVNAGGVLSGTLPSPTHLSSSRYGSDGISTSYIIPLAYANGGTYTTIMAESGSSSSNATGSYLRVKAGDGAALTVSANNPSTPNGGIFEIRGGEGGNLSSSAQYLTASSGQGGDLNIYGGDAGLLQGDLINKYYTLSAASEKATTAGNSLAYIPKIFKISDTSFAAFIFTSQTGAAAYYYTASGDTYGLASSTTFVVADTQSSYAKDYFELVRTTGSTYRFAYPSNSNNAVEIKQIELTSTSSTWGSPGSTIIIGSAGTSFLGIRAAANNGHFIVLYVNGSNVVASLRNSSALSTAGQLSSATIATTSEIHTAVKLEPIRLSTATTSTNMYVFGRAGTSLTGSINCKSLYFTSAGSSITTGSLTNVYGAYPSQINSIEIARVSSGSDANQMIMAVDGQGSSYVRFIPITAVSQSTSNQSVVTGTNYITTNELGAYKSATTFDDEKHAYFAHGSNILSSSYILSISGSGTTASINVVDSDNTFQTSITQSYSDAVVISNTNKKIVTFGTKNTTTFNTVQQTYSFNNIYAQKAGDINLIGGSAQKSLNPTELLAFSTGSSINLVTGDGYLGGSINLTATSGTTSGNINLLTSGSVNINSLGNTNISTTGGGTTPANLVLSTGIGTSQDGDIIIAAATGSTNGAGSSVGRGNLTLSASGDTTLAGANSVTIDSRLNNGTGNYTYIGQATTPYMFVGFNSILYYSSVSVTITAAGSTIQASAPILYISPDTTARTIATIEGRDSGSSAIDGQMLIIINPSATSYTLVETGNIKTSGTSAAVNINGGSVTLLYSSALGKWLQIGQPAVPVAV